MSDQPSAKPSSQLDVVSPLTSSCSNSSLAIKRKSLRCLDNQMPVVFVISGVKAISSQNSYAKTWDDSKMNIEDLESKYGFAKKFAESPTSDMLTKWKSQKSNPGSGQARMYFMLALTSALDHVLAHYAAWLCVGSWARTCPDQRSY